MGGHRGTGERKAEREAKAMKVSVVILNWNGCDMLRTFLPSVVRYSKGEGVEVCVADNGSTDASVEMLRQDFPSVRVILLDQNHGFADGYNLALQQVDADYVVLLNSDVEVTEHLFYKKMILLLIPDFRLPVVNQPPAHNQGFLVFLL